MAAAPLSRNRNNIDHSIDPHYCRVVPKGGETAQTARPVRQLAEIVTTRARPRWGDRLALAAVLALSTIVIAHGIHKGEFSFNVDETIHATTGLYFADLVRDLPLSHPVQYTYRY